MKSEADSKPNKKTKKEKKPKKGDETKKKTESDSSTTNTDRDLEKYMKSEEFLTKIESLQHNRLNAARNWIITVSIYYFVRATLIIFPNYNTETTQ